MKRYIKMVAALLALMASFTACENGDQAFDDYEGGTTAYFVYQSPVRTIVLGDDEYDPLLIRSINARSRQLLPALTMEEKVM